MTVELLRSNALVTTTTVVTVNVLKAIDSGELMKPQESIQMLTDFTSVE
jgi:hypothetical protein